MMTLLESLEKELTLQEESIKELLSYINWILWKCKSKYLIEYKKDWTAFQELISWTLNITITITNIIELQDLLLQLVRKEVDLDIPAVIPQA